MKLKHFTLKEFRCPCCHKVNMNEEFLKKLDKARDLAGVLFIITSGYRCPKHNKEVGGKPDSAHIKGLAADIECFRSRNRFKIIESLLRVGFTRIGVGKNFIHVDMDSSKPQRVIWTYYGRE